MVKERKDEIEMTGYLFEFLKLGFGLSRALESLRPPLDVVHGRR